MAIDFDTKAVMDTDLSETAVLNKIQKDLAGRPVSTYQKKLSFSPVFLVKDGILRAGILASDPLYEEYNVVNGETESRRLAEVAIVL